MKSTLLAERISDLRTAQDIHRKDMCKFLCVELCSYRRIEKGYRRVTLEELSIIAEKLNADYTELRALWLADEIIDRFADFTSEEVDAAIYIAQEKFCNKDY